MHRRSSADPRPQNPRRLLRARPVWRRSSTFCRDTMLSGWHSPNGARRFCNTPEQVRPCGSFTGSVIFPSSSQHRLRRFHKYGGHISRMIVGPRWLPKKYRSPTLGARSFPTHPSRCRSSQCQVCVIVFQAAANLPHVEESPRCRLRHSFDRRRGRPSACSQYARAKLTP